MRYLAPQGVVVVIFWGRCAYWVKYSKHGHNLIIYVLMICASPLPEEARYILCKQANTYFLHVLKSDRKCIVL